VFLGGGAGSIDTAGPILFEPMILRVFALDADGDLIARAQASVAP
jgi:hypothetical protein